MSLKIKYNPSHIVNHLLNNSPSKYTYSFSSSPRFFKLKQDDKVDKFYDLPSTLNKRATAMGFGKKSNFTPKNNSEFISIKRYFDKGNQPGHKYSFGISRDKYKKVLYPGIRLIDFDIPGPGKYNIVAKPGFNSPKYTMRPKCEKNIFLKNRILSPGPGEYSTIVHINSEGKYPLSGMPNVKTINFGSRRAKRFIYKYNDNPGPGMYKNKSLFGVNYNSKYNSGKFISIHKKIKYTNKVDDTPGPGTYSSFSEFGMPAFDTESTFRKSRMKKIKKIILLKGKREDNKTNKKKKKDMI